MKLKNISVNRILACLIAVFIFAFSMNFSFDANASNTSRIYRRYNATTGAFLGRYMLGALNVNDNVSTYNVIGSDDRVVDFTKSGVVKLMGSDEYIGTGFVVDSHTIATAAHCIWDYDNNSSIQISEIRLFDANGNISKTVTPVEAHIPQIYLNNKGAGYDYGVITVNEDLSDYAIFDLGVPLYSASDNELAISVTGFPKYLHNNEEEVVNSDTLDNMYTGNGVLSASNSNDVLYYTADASEGNSGGPVYITTSYYGTVYYTVIGIHTSGSSIVNSGVSMTTDLLHFYLNNSHI